MGSILPCCLPYGKAGGLQILCCQGIKVTDYNFTLDALALKPSSFCNVRLIINQAVDIRPAEHFGAFPGPGGKEFFKPVSF